MYDRQEVQNYLKTRVARPSSAGIILEDESSRALVLKANYKQYWSFPGGWVEDEQTPLEAAVRELEEEAGISLAAESLEFAYVINRKSELMQTYQFIFRTTQLYVGEKLVLQPSEIDEARFVSKDEVLANQGAYGLAVVLWAQDDTRGYVEQQL